MKVLLTGASGQLGSACRAIFDHYGIEVAPVSIESAWALARQRSAGWLGTAQVLIHAAANTNVEQCELEPEACYRDNYLLTEGLADACAVAGIAMVYISSTGVYGESQGEPYCEYSETFPTTHHHRAKWLGEKAVLAAARVNLVIRTGWLFGGEFANPKNFVARRLEEATRAAAAGVPLFANAEQHGCPTHTGDVADRLLLLIREGQRGLFNLVNEGTASRLDYVQAIVASAGLTLPVRAAPAAHFRRNAKVSSNEMAVNWRANALGLAALPSWQDSLNRYVHDSLTDSQYGY